MFKYLQWFFSLAVTFSRALPANMLVMVFCGLFSRVSAMLALLLPVKILLLVGSDRVPRYFPEFFQEIPQETLIQILCAATIVLYALSVGLEKVASNIESEAERLLVSHLDCSPSDARMVKLLRKSYSKVSGNLTDLLFIVAALLFIIFSYPTLVVTLIIYSAVVLAGYELFSTHGHRADAAIDGHDENSNDDSGSIGLWVDVGFLISFFFIVLGMLADWGPGLIVAFICFLLLRRSSGALKRFLKNLVVIYSQKSILSTLFESTGSVSSGESERNGFSDDNVAYPIITTVLSETFPDAVIDDFSLTKFDQADDSIDAYILDVDILDERRQFLIKIFLDKMQRAKAELELFGGMSKQSFKGVASCGRCQGIAWLLVGFVE